jgi:hypothetical protein
MAKLKDSPPPGRPPAKAAPLSVAWRYALLVGEPAPGRVPGWVTFHEDADRRPDGEWGWTRAGDALWAQHRAALIAEATRHGFEPYWETSRPPAGPGFRAWRDQFLAANSY